MKFSITFSVAASALLSTAAAQYAIDPTTVSNNTRSFWCQQQIAQCPLICLQTENTGNIIQNQCDPSALQYSCICSNGISPNVSMFTQTLPFFICQEWGNQCSANCNNDNTCQAACRDNHPCGAQNPTRQNTSTLTSMSSTSSAAGAGASGSGGVYSGFGGSGAATTSGGSGAAGSSGSAAGASGAAETSRAAAARVQAAALNMGSTFGLLGVVGALFGGFAVLL